MPREPCLSGVRSGTEQMSEGLWLQALWVMKTSGIWPSPLVRSPLEGPAVPLHTPCYGNLTSCKQS